MASPLTLGYLDDVTLGGKTQVVADDIGKLEAQCKTLCLLLNRSKCEVISRPPSLRSTNIKHQLNQFTWTSPDHAMRLGAHLSTCDALSEALAAGTAELTRMLYRLADVATHDALILLRYSVSATRLLHTLRCCPCAD